MGCDIHTYREKFSNGAWLTADTWTPYDSDESVDVDYKQRAYTGRNYDLFGTLADGVRRDFSFALKQRGLPFDVSLEVKAASDQWNGDGHSHSYLYLHELKALRQWMSTKTMPVSGMKDADELATLRKSIASGSPDWKLLYPYCQSTNAPNAVEFELDIPMDFNIGPSLDHIIASFDGIDGENHRLVFWFDN